MIWGLTLKPGASCTRVFSEEVHLSLASMESRKEFGRIWPGSYSQVVMKTEEVEFLLCTLVHGSVFQQSLDLKLMPNERITFTAYGDCLIYISGYTSYNPQTREEDGADSQKTYDGFDATDYNNPMRGDTKIRPTSESASWIPDDSDDPRTNSDDGDNVTTQILPDEEHGHIITIKEEVLQDSSTHIEQVDQPAGTSNPPTDMQPSSQGHGIPPNEEGQHAVIADLETLSDHRPLGEISYGESSDGNDGNGHSSPGDFDRSNMDEDEGPTTARGLWRSRLSPMRTGKMGKTRRAAGKKDTSHWVDLDSYGRRPEMANASGSGPPVTGIDTHSMTGPASPGGTLYTIPEIGVLSDDATEFTPRLSHLDSNSAAREASFVPPTITRVVGDTLSRRRGRKQLKIRTGKVKGRVSNSKGHSCSVCQKSFIKLCSLVRHERIHTGIKPYLCRICWKPFSDAGNRTKHERIHDKRSESFSCVNCGRVFPSPPARAEHQQTCNAGGSS